MKALERADWYDRLIIGAAFLLFLLVVAWVIKRRVLDKVVGGLAGGVGWWVGGSWKLLKMGIGAGSSAAVKGEQAAASVLPGTRIGKAGAEVVAKVASSAGAVTAAAGAAVSSAVAAGRKHISDEADERPRAPPSTVQDLIPQEAETGSEIGTPAGDRPPSVVVKDEL